jgi:hypothetical protein
MSRGGHKPLDLPMQVAEAFVKDMRAFPARAALHLLGLRQARRGRAAGFQLGPTAGRYYGLSVRACKRGH